MFTLLRYRVNQFAGRLRPRLSGDDWALVEATLGRHSPQLALFERMSRGDQQHAVAVLRTLLSWQTPPPPLAQAALLHDVAKALGQPLVHRVLVVLLEMLAPSVLTRLAQAPLTCAAWRRPFVVHARHHHLGADWAAAINSHPQTVALIRHHPEKPNPNSQSQFARLQALLYKADGMN